ncbi:MAG: hypothetical protein KBI44_17250 [Thermoanaerobaculia bacterium]|jgi:hypothetical protein|nr:hypothetical protein [Thermoanaerobaculia bacterium]
MPRPLHLSRLRKRSADVGLAGLALILAGAVTAGAQAGEGASRRERMNALVASVGAYVERFQAEMEAAVLDESYVQLLRQPCCREPRRPGEDPLLAWDDTHQAVARRGLLARRQLKSEVLLVRIAGGMRVGYRDVYEVDGRKIQDRSQRVRNLFLSGTDESALALGRIATESARFNLGQMQRTTNLPTLPMLYLVPAMHPRLYFSRGGDEEMDGTKTTVLEFREDASPTLAATAAGIDMPARGRAWVEPDTGRIRRIELRFAAGARRVMTVWFRDDPRVEFLPPARMWEWYERIPVGDVLPAGNLKGGWSADVEALATYTDLRLFSVETSEDIGAPPD